MEFNNFFVIISIKSSISLLAGGFRGEIDPESITISGVSSGAAFAHQFHLAYSGTVNGAGLIAGSM